MLGVGISEQAADEGEKEQARELPKEVEEELTPDTPEHPATPVQRKRTHFGGEDSWQTTYHKAACSSSCSRPFTATSTRSVLNSSSAPPHLLL